MGGYVTNIDYIIGKDLATAAKYTGLQQAARISLIAKGIQTSDLHGSLAYSEAWRTRADGQSDADLNPAFQTQEELYEVWDTELKAAIETLKGLGAKDTELEAYDRAYDGNLKRWIAAANGLRLRIALRFWNRKPDRAKEIATEVLASGNAANTMQSIADSYVLWHNNDYTIYNDGDWHSIYDMNCASGPFMDYLKEHKDPRKEIFFLPNNLTPENIAAYNAQPNDKKVGFKDASGNLTNANRNISPHLTQWEGGTVSFDKREFNEPYLARTLSGATSVNMRAMNYPQTKLWKGTGYDGRGTGGNFAPTLTYADYCFMAAEFTLRMNVASGKSAQAWYEAGVAASLKQWDKFGKYTKVDNYEPLKDADIEAFLAQDGIRWDQSKALEQIYSQAYVEHFKNTNESWMQWKRTGYPNSKGTLIKLDDVLINGQV